MVPLTDRQVAEYFHRSYKAVDGLWFVKVEQRLGFDAALDIDDEVWAVMPKIQARKLQELTGLRNGLDALRACFTTKLVIEGFEFAEAADGDGFAVTLTRCPWYDLLLKSNRAHLAATIGDRICTTEYSTWASEFGKDLRFESGERICRGCATCTLRFRREPPG